MFAFLLNRKAVGGHAKIPRSFFDLGIFFLFTITFSPKNLEAWDSWGGQKTPPAEPVP